LRGLHAEGKRALVLGRVPTIECRLIVWELDYHIARAARPFGSFELPAANNETGAIFLKGNRGIYDIFIVFIGVDYINPPNPVPFGIIFSRCWTNRVLNGASR
jgi:hypothetical protein